MRYLQIGLLWLLTSCTDGKVPKAEPSYELDVRPIFKARCVGCHANYWLNYQTVIDNINKIEYKVLKARQMPPGGLTTYEYETINNWIKHPVK